MDPWLDLFTHGLATYRLSLMIAKEAGPGWAFKWLRRTVKREAPKKTHMDEGIDCLFCMSMQIALAVVVARHFWAGNPLYDGLMLALALSGIAVILNQQFTKGTL